MPCTSQSQRSPRRRNARFLNSRLAALVSGAGISTSVYKSLYPPPCVRCPWGIIGAYCTPSLVVVPGLGQGSALDLHCIQDSTRLTSLSNPLLRENSKRNPSFPRTPDRGNPRLIAWLLLTSQLAKLEAFDRRALPLLWQEYHKQHEQLGTDPAAQATTCALPPHRDAIRRIRRPVYTSKRTSTRHSTAHAIAHVTFLGELFLRAQRRATL